MDLPLYRPSHAVDGALDGEPISYMLGGWEAPYGIEYRIDVVNAWVLVIVSMIPSVVLPFGSGSEGLDLHPDKQYLYYAALLLCLTGLLGMTATGTPSTSSCSSKSARCRCIP